jgi:dynein heavy chain
MEQEAPTWRKWYSDIEPELTDLPKSVKDISLFHRILLLRALRPDRLINALKQFVKENMGIEFVEQPSFDMA